MTTVTLPDGRTDGRTDGQTNNRFKGVRYHCILFFYDKNPISYEVFNLKWCKSNSLKPVVRLSVHLSVRPSGKVTVVFTLLLGKL